MVWAQQLSSRQSSVGSQLLSALQAAVSSSWLQPLAASHCSSAIQGPLQAASPVIPESSLQLLAQAAKAVG